MRPSISREVPLAPLTSLGVGGAARFYARVTDEDGVAHALAWAREHDVPWMILGSGSNIVVGDDGYDGLVMHLDSRGVKAVVSPDGVRVTAAAGEPWDAFVGHCVSRGWAGIECLSGIPGRVGATPIQNVGAYGQEVSETIERVTAFDTVELDTLEIEAEACRFAYRDSWFKTGEPDRYVITSVTYRLEVDGPPATRHGEVTKLFEELGVARPTLPQVRHAVIAIRRRKSMVLDPTDTNSQSVGSFFVNPVVDAATRNRVVEAARTHGVLSDDEEMPAFAIEVETEGDPAVEERFKLSAAWLIERAGITKGYRRGAVGISDHHSLAIVNRGGATAREVVALAEEVRAKVRDRFGLTLVPEPRFVGLPALS